MNSINPVNFHKKRETGIYGLVLSNFKIKESV